MAQGVVKSYDPNTGNGIILLDADKTEVFITAGSLKGSIFRMLRQGQRINFKLETVEGMQIVKDVKIGQDKY
jgi:CspA family cold shock protein